MITPHFKLFEEYIHIHLLRRVLPESIHRQRIFQCHDCGETITERQAKRRRERGFKTISYPVCETMVSLLDRKERLIADSRSAISEIDRTTDIKRKREKASSILYREFVERGCPVIPVILQDAHKKTKLPIFLKGMTWTDFRKDKPDPLDHLIRGITGRK